LACVLVGAVGVAVIVHASIIVPLTTHSANFGDSSRFGSPVVSAASWMEFQSPANTRGSGLPTRSARSRLMGRLSSGRQLPYIAEYHVDLGCATIVARMETIRPVVLATVLDTDAACASVSSAILLAPGG